MSFSIRKLLGVAVGIILIGLTSQVQAVPVNYQFTGTITGSLDLGGGLLNFNNAPLTVTGMTLDDADVNPIVEAGNYSAMSTYSIGGVGVFITDGSTGEFYFQFLDIGSGLINQAGLTNADGSDGFGAVVFAGIAPGDPNAGAVPLGGPIVPDATGVQPRTLTNLAAHTLSFLGGDIVISEFSVVAKRLPEPGTLAIFALGLAGLGFLRRAKRCP